MKDTTRKAPELVVSDWLNTDAPILLSRLAGKVVVIEAFQMLCPGCVSHGLPQAQRVAATFAGEDVAVIGLHTVFEHHAAQGTREALEAFLHEYRIRFPVGIDAPGANSATPQTMTAYGLRGTPSLVLIDKQGRYHNAFFGQVSDMALGAHIMGLVGLDKAETEHDDNEEILTDAQGGCSEQGCATPQGMNSPCAKP